MVSIVNIFFFGLMGGTLALPKPQGIDSFPTNVGCGEVNVFYTYAADLFKPRQTKYYLTQAGALLHITHTSLLKG